MCVCVCVCMCMYKRQIRIINLSQLSKDFLLFNNISVEHGRDLKIIHLRYFKFE